MWEYKIEQDCDETTLNKLGAQGWELVAVVQSVPLVGHLKPTYTKFYFKRPKP